VTENSAEERTTVTIALYPEGGEEKALRQIGYGIQPFVLLEVEPEEEGDGVIFKVVGSLIESHEELLEVLEAFLDVTKDALEQHRAAQVAEGDEE
jgi:hypothetical protein